MKIKHLFCIPTQWYIDIPSIELSAYIWWLLDHNNLDLYAIYHDIENGLLYLEVSFNDDPIILNII